MSVTVKGDSPFDAFIVSGIKDCQTEHIKFYNISFNCKTIEDADGRTFTRSEEPKRGKWKYISDGYVDIYECDQCGKTEDYERNFCPNCGAKMER